MRMYMLADRQSAGSCNRRDTGKYMYCNNLHENSLDNCSSHDCIRYYNNLKEDIGNGKSYENKPDIGHTLLHILRYSNCCNWHLQK